MITEFNKFSDENLIEIISDTIEDYVDIWNDEKSIDWSSAIFTATEITNLLGPIQLKNLDIKEISNIINDNLEIIGGGITIDSIEKTSKKIFDYLNNIIGGDLDKKFKMLKKIDTYNL